MGTKLIGVAAVAAALLLGGSGVALADPVSPTPDPNAPKCWTSGDSGYLHIEWVPCGWTFSDKDGWQRIPPPPGEPNPGD
ncbi:hypothetical protein [Candidatus Mycobacterium methanotrophicum]|uniref:Secreted protein n=1 Tax=Candidatus Mycobacterium methanotrophicum TaxID=2943498 RepID=A0ABY4QM88_9MYCO|nr:hypothetical protein [Candidatus Mycobacterium methanotrophicum]UQX10956.1 hypothetical protein M5I08_24065 [Candidatus Mycobacterium methanotrophicum]